MSLAGEAAPRVPEIDQPSSTTVFARILLLGVAIRVALEIIGLASLAAHHQPVLANAIALWNHWDAPHYLRVAEVGYRPASVPGDDPLFIVFFPVFPMAVRLVSFGLRDLVVSGLVVSFAATVGAAWFLYRLVRIDHDHPTAWRTLVLLFAFPTAYFLSAPYTEALFLFAVVACVYAARADRWPHAGIAGAVATGTRVAGVALAPALVAETFARPGSAAQRTHRLGWSAVTGAGLAVYLAINRLVYQDPLWFLHVQRMHWYQHVVWPWQPIIDAARGLIHGASPPFRLILGGRVAAFVFALVLLTIALRRVRTADWLYAWGGFVLLLSTSWLISLPRYLLGLYPLFIVMARLTRSPWIFWPVVAAGAGVQAYFFWVYASGQWTF